MVGEVCQKLLGKRVFGRMCFNSHKIQPCYVAGTTRSLMLCKGQKQNKVRFINLLWRYVDILPIIWLWLGLSVSYRMRDREGVLIAPEIRTKICAPMKK